jgi:WD40 repeat protein
MLGVFIKRIFTLVFLLGLLCICNPLMSGVPGTVQFTLKEHTGNINSIRWSPDGSKIATASADSSAIIWDTKTGFKLLKLKGDFIQSSVIGLHWSPDGSKIITHLRYLHEVRLWSAGNGKILSLLNNDAFINAIQWSPNGTEIAAAELLETKIFSSTGSWINTVETIGSNDVQWSPDGSKIATMNKFSAGMLIWDVKSNEQLQQYGGAGDCSSQGFSEPIRWSPDGSKILTSCERGNTVVREFGRKEPLFYLSGTQPQWILNGSKIATRFWDSCYIYSSTDGKKLLTLGVDTDTITWNDVFLENPQWSPDGSKIAALERSIERKIVVWSATNGEKLYILSHSAPINDFNWSPDGSKIATCDTDGIAKIWFITDPSPSTVQEATLQPVTAFSISPNPTRGSFTATFERACTLPTELRICNLLGQTVAIRNIPSGVNEWRVMTEDLPAGMYMVQYGAWVRLLVVY